MLTYPQNITAALVNSGARIIRHSNVSIDAFQSARQVLETMTAQISQATLNTYLDYYNDSQVSYRDHTDGNFTPTWYGRDSDLHFIAGCAPELLPQPPSDAALTATHALFFVAPADLAAEERYQKLSGLMSARDYFVAFASDEAARPRIVSTPVTWRWRLMELTAPTETLTVFNGHTGADWFRAPVAGGQARAVADNIIALIVWPRRAQQDVIANIPEPQRWLLLSVSAATLLALRRRR
ncbi:MAG: hypothetical protein LBK60_04105 [Verrucomicrobiales bacterium]|nr:hypothetical protein [Verrucomicrobiales bacterium]